MVLRVGQGLQRIFHQGQTIWSGSTALFRSRNGFYWEPDPEHPIAYLNELEFEEGMETFSNLERPQMYIEDGKTRFLLCACKLRREDDVTYNVKIPLRENT